MSEEKMREQFCAWWQGGDRQVIDELYSPSDIAFFAWKAACTHKDSEFAKERERANVRYEELRKGAYEEILPLKEELTAIKEEREKLRAEIEKYRTVATDNKDWFDQTKEEFDKRGALISMQAEVLKSSSLYIDDIHKQCGIVACSISAEIREAISASAESVAAWESEKLEPLRREVAMFVDGVSKYRNACFGKQRHDAVIALWEMAENTQATAEAYERELKAKAMEEAADRVANFCGCDIPLRKQAAELRAQSAQKKEGE